MHDYPRVLAMCVPLALVFACQADDTASEAAGDTGTETSGDGDGDPSGDGDGDMTGDGDGDITGDGDGDMTGDGDGDMTGDGDGDPSGDGDGDPSGDGDGDMTGDGDGDMTGDGDGDPVGEAMLRVVHLGLDAGAVDLYLDDAVDPFVAALAFESGTDYVAVPAGMHTLTVKAAGDPDTTLLTLDALALNDGVDYSAVAYDYLADIAGLVLVDDASNLDPGDTRLQVTHAAADIGQIDVWTLTDPPVLLIEDLDFGATTSIDLTAGPGEIGIDTDDDAVPDLTFGLPDFGAGNFIDLYAVNESGGTPSFLLAHLPAGTTERIDADVCGDGITEGLEVCDGADLGGATCMDFGESMGELGCLPDCSGYDTSACSSELVVCNDVATPIPDGAAAPVTSSIVLDDLGTIADIRVSVDVSHTWLADLDVRLDKDGSAATWMFRDIKEIGTDISCDGDDMVASLDDAAATSIQTNACNDQATPAVDGTFTPEEPLSAFDGMSIAGTWNLVVDDDSDGDVGQVNQWCVHITPG